MKKRLLLALTILVGPLAGVAVAQNEGAATTGPAPAEPVGKAQAGIEYYKPVEYGSKNSLELGGTFAFNWTDQLLTLSLGPTFGWFVADRFELSILPSMQWVRVKQDDGSHTNTTTGSVVFEPSYHYPVRPELLYVFGGLGIGGGFDGRNGDFELVPRFGANIQVGRSGFLDPAVRLPILLGSNSGPDNSDFGVDFGVIFEIGYTTIF